MRTKRGLSGVITTMMLILLALVLVGVIWAVVTNLVGENLEETQSCFGLQEKITINEAYTCYSTGAGELNISLGRTDVSLDELIVFISGAGQTQSFSLTTNAQAVSNVEFANGTTNVFLPGENTGYLYTYNYSGAGFSGVPDKIDIVPVINGNQCDVVDSTSDLVNCNALG